jgi:hypothetical protein
VQCSAVIACQPCPQVKVKVKVIYLYLCPCHTCTYSYVCLGGRFGTSNKYCTASRYMCATSTVVVGQSATAIRRHRNKHKCDVIGVS